MFTIIRICRIKLEYKKSHKHLVSNIHQERILVIDN